MFARLLKLIRRPALAGLALALPALIGFATPASAGGWSGGWSGPNSFSLGFGGGGYVQLAPVPPAHVPYHPVCLSQHQVKRGLNDQGFTRVSFEDSNDEAYFVLAVADGWVYSLIVDCCTGELIDIEKLHRIDHGGCGCDDDFHGGPPHGNANGHFKLNFQLH